MYEVIGYVKDAECMICEKPQECVAVKCKAGTMEGNLCSKCLLKQCKIRAAGAKKPAPANGQQVHEVPG